MRTVSGPTNGEDFRALSRQILRHASRGIGKGDFVQRITELLLKFSGCERVEILFRDRERYLACSADHIEGTSLSLIQRSEEMDNILSGKETPASVEYLSTLHVPVLTGRRHVGSVRLNSSRKNHFPPRIKKLYREMGDSLGLAIAHVQVRSELQERIKEMTCLYGIARIAAQPDTWLEEVLERVAHVLPAAWLHANIAGARIVYNGQAFTTPNYRGAKSVQRAHIVVAGKRRGLVEVAYFEEKPRLDEGPFLKEERKLIETVAEEVAAIISRREAERDKLRLEDRLRHTDRLSTLGQLAAGIAHELNEPLAAIVGFAQLAKKCSGLPEQADKDIDRVLTASLQARDIVRRLLRFTRQTPPRKMNVDLNQLVSESLKFFESRCIKEGIKVICTLAPAMPEIEADPTQLNQVLVNLLVNALHAMPGGGTLKVRTSSRVPHATLTIEDTGTGMDAQLLESIFTPFFTTKDMDEGTGLGLPIAHGIVTSHGGTLTITSKPGEGTRCVVRLPAGQIPFEPGDKGDG